MAAQPHPYAAAWQPWDERYEQHLKSKRNWQIACGLSSLASVILAGGIVCLACTQSVNKGRSQNAHNL